ncbi:MAG: AraC family transcriptional regulator [Oscillospiraceae bacterium]
MLVNFEKRYYENEMRIWHREYCDLENIVHWHKEYEIIYVKKGIAKIGVNKETYDAQTGDLIICQSGDMHYIKSIESGTICEVLIFDNEYLNFLVHEPYTLPVCIKSSEVEQNHLNLSECFYSVLMELKGEKPCANEMIKMHLTNFFVSCIRTVGQKKESVTQQTYKKKLLESYQDLLENIDKNYKDINFEKSAKFMNFAPPYFSKIFSEIAGMTFTDYLNYVRIEKAVLFIQDTDLKITDIAEKCGFNNIRSFNRIFKKITGSVPTGIDKDYKFPSDLHPVRNENMAFDATVYHSELKI